MTGGRVDATGHRRVAPVAGVALLTLTISLVAIGAVLLFGGGDSGGVVWGLPGVPGLWALGFSVAGYPITRRHPANPVGWCLMLAGVAAGMTLLGFGLGVPDAADGGLASRLVGAWVISVGALTTAVVLFPSGSPPSRWWWVQLGVLWGSGVLAYFAEPYDPSVGFIGLPGWLDPIAAPVKNVFQLSLVAGLFSLLVRWRRSGEVVRLQLKWVVYGVALVGTTALVVETGLANLAPAWYLPGTAVLSVVILAVPASMGVAMLRYRLFDIDAVINRTLVYGSLTGVLALVYLGGIIGLQYAFRALTGQETQLAVVASTLVIAALFTPLRQRIQSFIDRRFYRQKYDARKTLEAFSEKLRGTSDLDGLNGELLAVVRETVRPEHAALWLRIAPEQTAGERAAGR
jgi:hypothetical protein